MTQNASPSRIGRPGPIELLVGTAPGRLTEGSLLFLRLVLALIFFAHGWDTMINLGISGTIELQRENGIPLPVLAGPFTIFIELIGGPLLALGGLTRVVAAGLTVLMVGAFAFLHAPYGIFVENGGFELVLVLAAASVAVALHGGGRYSLDSLAASRLIPAARPDRT